MSSLNKQYQGQEYWRSLAELAQSPEIAEKLQQEFVGYDPDALRKSSRRGFLKLMSASMALAGLTLSGCRRWPVHEVKPHSHQPEGTMPGVPQYYASMMEMSGVATGVLVKSYDGRPIKVEGNALHPFSLGAANTFAQASVLEMYDPSRSRQITQRNGDKRDAKTLDEFLAAVKPAFASAKKEKGKGLAIVARPTGSPTLLRLKAALLKDCPQAIWCEYEAINRDNEIAGMKLAFGRAVRPQYDLSKAKVIACFDSDLLGLHPAHQRLARQWADGRNGETGEMNRVYAAETMVSITGGAADHRLPVKPSRIASLLSNLASQLGVIRVSDTLEGEEAAFVEALAKDLQSARGASLVTVGFAQPAELHAIAAAINEKLGAVGKTISYIDEIQGGANISVVSGALQKGEITTLLILDGNPVYDAPADLNFDPSGTTAIHCSSYLNETSAKCEWHVPMAHFLESWGDGSAWDGTYSIQQPLILPLFDGKSCIELLAALTEQSVTAGMDLVRATAKEQYKIEHDDQWTRLLHDGLLAGSAAPIVSVTAKPQAAYASRSNPKGFEVLFIADNSVYDGSFGDNGWLQELPDPMTKLVWDNAALMNKEDADAMELTTGSMIQLKAGDIDDDNARGLKIAVYVMPGLPRRTIVLPLGYGRTVGGQISPKIGFNTYWIRTTGNEFLATNINVKRAKGKYTLAMTQEHHLIDAIGAKGRDERVGEKGKSGLLIREASLEEFKKEPDIFQEGEEELARQLFDPPSKFNDPHAWGMAVDVNRCIGCTACVVACQSENNIPIVGKTQVANNREMSWIRIDRYFKGNVSNPDLIFTPVMCVHCENAPCEQVCPVAATTHDAEGLNTMVYNRCIGTRYCSNNCPYKVRRFNYFDFHVTNPRGKAEPWVGIPDQQQQTIDAIKQMIFNPDVTVRMRGVMEKCTYCVQRIQGAKIAAKVEHGNGRRDSDKVADGEVVTACQGACPTQAISFGDLNDEESKVAKAHEGKRAYAMLEHLNLKPRTKYLAKLRNPVEEKA